MRNKYLTIAIHIIAWSLLLMVPFLSYYKVLKSFASMNDGISLLPAISLSLILIVIFYFNYFILIPKFLLLRKYYTYVIALVLSIVAAFVFSGIFLNLSNFNPSRLESINPVLIKIEPIFRTNGFLLLVISILASIAVTINNHLRQTEEEKLSAQISSLKSQINPHFLFNTLNNIYATAIDKSPQTADMIDKLSEMMRYTMKETQKDFVPLDEEINYIINFIELQKLRLEQGVNFNFSIEGDLSGLQIAPMMLIPFVENAFKHGINSEQKSKIVIRIEVHKTEIHLFITNSKVKVQTDTRENNGLGVENTKHRLDLIYPTHYMLKIEDTERDYTVSLKIRLV